MEDNTAEATDSLPKQAGGIVGLDLPLDSLDLTKILAKEFEEQEQGSEEPEATQPREMQALKLGGLNIRRFPRANYEDALQPPEYAQ